MVLLRTGARQSHSAENCTCNTARWKSTRLEHSVGGHEGDVVVWAETAQLFHAAHTCHAATHHHKTHSAGGGRWVAGGEGEGGRPAAGGRAEARGEGSGSEQEAAVTAKHCQRRLSLLTHAMQPRHLAHVSAIGGWQQRLQKLRWRHAHLGGAMGGPGECCQQKDEYAIVRWSSLIAQSFANYGCQAGGHGALAFTGPPRAPC